MAGAPPLNSVGNSGNAIESFVDEMAWAEGVDPVQFRIERMQMSPRGRAVFEKVVQMSDWKTPRPAGRAVGISISERSGSLGAGVAEISLDRASGRIKVHKVWLADGDQFILSKGHGASSLYATLHHFGRLSDDDFATYYKDGTLLPAHPAPGALPNERVRPLVLRRQLDKVACLTRGEAHDLATLREALDVQEIVEAMLGE